jgi:hypothetical protein
VFHLSSIPDIGTLGRREFILLKTATELRDVVDTVLPRLEAITDAEASLRPSPDKWSNKEVLGHLLDSACNNQQKFVRTMAESGVNFPGYEQDFWIASQKYNNADWGDLVSLWRVYNRHIAHIIEHAEPALLSNLINIGGVGTYTLEFMMEDYVVHLKHHLKQILPNDFGF